MGAVAVSPEPRMEMKTSALREGSVILSKLARSVLQLSDLQGGGATAGGLRGRAAARREGRAGASAGVARGR
jgi:hypothetical protein